VSAPHEHSVEPQDFKTERTSRKIYQTRDQARADVAEAVDAAIADHLKMVDESFWNAIAPETQ
jgi:hypothetical protein